MADMKNTVSPGGKAKKKSEFMRIMRQLAKNKMAMLGLAIFIIEIILTLLADWIAPYPYDEMNLMMQFAKPSLAHPMGCDDMGRDILSRILVGARYSLSMGVIGVIISCVVGGLLGSIAGYVGGKVDDIMMRCLDVIQSIPGLVMIVVLAALLGSGYINTILALALSSIPFDARMMRAQILKERGNEYIEAAYSINCSHARILLTHLIPNCFSPMIVSATMGIGTMITFASSLSFIGLGIRPPIPEWGAILSTARTYMRQAPHMLLFPGLAIAITVLALNLLGDGLRDALDPKMKT